MGVEGTWLKDLAQPTSFTSGNIANFLSHPLPSNDNIVIKCKGNIHSKLLHVVNNYIYSEL